MKKKKKYLSPHSEIINLNLNSNIADGPIIVGSGGTPQNFGDNDNGISGDSDPVDNPWGDFDS